MPSCRERLAAEHPSQRQPTSAGCPVAPEGFDGVGAAGRGEAAVRAEQGAEVAAVALDRRDEGPDDRPRPARLFGAAHRGLRGRRAERRAESSSTARAELGAAPAPAPARTTTRVPAGRSSSRSRRRWRRRREVRCRTTELPTALLTTRPARAGSGEALARSAGAGSGLRRPPAGNPTGPTRACTVTSERDARRPPRRTSENSAAVCRRDALGSTTAGQAQADSSLRPLRRRPARMARPARVRMRSRKPWVFARRRLFGWKVRLLTTGLALEWPGAVCLL